jgi:hypothetical protein
MAAKIDRKSRQKAVLTLENDFRILPPINHMIRPPRLVEQRDGRRVSPPPAANRQEKKSSTWIGLHRGSVASKGQ